MPNLSSEKAIRMSDRKTHMALTERIASHAKRLNRATRKRYKRLRVATTALRCRIRGELASETSYDRAITRLGELIRFNPKARDSLITQKQLDELLTHKSPDFISHRIDEQQPLCFVLFIGYSRSGHSLVGSLLDAHPEAVISHELHAAKLFKKGAQYAQVLRFIKHNSFFFDYFGREYTGYDYRVPGYYQGTYQTLKIAGDKKANRTTQLLRQNPELLEHIISSLPVPLRLIHVIRNPFDNIATKSLRTQKSLSESATNYFSNVAYIDRIKKERPDLVLDLHLDDLINEPENTLRQLTQALGLSVTGDYLQACAGIVASSPSQTRYRVSWTDGLWEQVNADIQRYPFLQRYSATSL